MTKKIKKQFEIKTWSGKPLYCCTKCEFDTLDETAIYDHIAAHIIPSPLPDLPSLDAETDNQTPAKPIPAEKEKVDGIFEIDLKEDQQDG